MGYSGTLRSQYRQSGGAAIDNTAARTAFDPTPARVALFTDVDFSSKSLFYLMCKRLLNRGYSKCSDIQV
jgi:hypothetical protein